MYKYIILVCLLDVFSVCVSIIIYIYIFLSKYIVDKLLLNGISMLIATKFFANLHEDLPPRLWTIQIQTHITYIEIAPQSTASAYLTKSISSNSHLHQN